MEVLTDVVSLCSEVLEDSFEHADVSFLDGRPLGGEAAG